MDTFAADVRYAWRMLRNNPQFTNGGCHRVGTRHRSQYRNLFWFSVKMRGSVSPKERRFRPSGGDFQGIGIYRSDMVLFF
jgi:hypothetical protein